MLFSKGGFFNVESFFWNGGFGFSNVRSVLNSTNMYVATSKTCAEIGNLDHEQLSRQDLLFLENVILYFFVFCSFRGGFGFGNTRLVTKTANVFVTKTENAL